MRRIDGMQILFIAIAGLCIAATYFVRDPAGLVALGFLGGIAFSVSVAYLMATPVRSVPSNLASTTDIK